MERRPNGLKCKECGCEDFQYVLGGYLVVVECCACYTSTKYLEARDEYERQYA